MTSTPPPRARGTVVGSYELVERIGEGGMGEVWKARDRVLDRVVALKFLSGKPGGHNDLIREARAASSLNHPNIVTVFQIGDCDGDSYLAMEFVEGRSLRHYLGSASQVGEALEISEQIVDGLACAHERGVIHRDLKPENIMIRIDGQVKLVDFGLAKRVVLDDGAVTSDSALTESGHLVGTFSYMSPEQARGKPLTPASDVFSLGIVMYELFSGRHPFRREEMLDTLTAIVRDEPPALNPEREAPPSVETIVSRALKKPPGERYSSAVEISEPIKRAREVWDRTVITTAPVPVLRQTSMRTRVIGITMLAVIAAAGAWSIFRPDVLAGTLSPAVRTIAVMPFRTPDSSAAVFAEPLPEDLSSLLSRVGFQVASRTSVAQMVAAGDARAAAVELGVDAVLDGTLRMQGSLVRIYVELVNSRTGFQIWSRTFTADRAALLSGLESATTIAQEIRTVAGGQQ